MLLKCFDYLNVWFPWKRLLGLVAKRFYNLHVTACLPITTMHEVSLLIQKDIMPRILRDYFLQSFPLLCASF